MFDVVEYDGVLYRRRIRGPYYILHPIVDGHIDYDNAVYEHRLIYEIANNVKLDRATAIHHVNHNKLDNNPDNLVALSAGEHSALHAKEDGKHVGGYFCVDCGKEITQGATRCVRCSCLASRTKNHPTKESLAELITRFNNSEIGRMLGVSDTAVKKWRMKYGLPSATDMGLVGGAALRA